MSKQIDALKLALEAFEGMNHEDSIFYGEFDDKIAAIKEALAHEKALQALHDENERLGLYKDAYAQPEQEPVAWVDLLKEAQQIVESKVLWKRFIDGTPLSNDIACWMAAFAQQHTTPSARRKWVWLTDADIFSVLENLQMMYNRPPKEDSRVVFALAIEAKSKEKNT